MTDGMMQEVTPELAEKLAALDAEFEQEDSGAVDGAILDLLETKNGKRFLWWLLSVTHVYNNGFTEDPRRTAFNLGEQNIGQQLLGRISTLAPEKWFELEKEMFHERNGRARIRHGIGSE